MGILKRLSAEDPRIRRRILAEKKAVLESIDVDEIADEVCGELRMLDVEDLWDRSGPKRNGYIDPADMAVEMVEGTLEPYFERVMKYAEMKMPIQAREYCMGVLRGIYDFAHGPRTDFRDNAPDEPAEYFGWLLENWRKNCSSGDLERMNHFISEHCPRGSEWAIKRKQRFASGPHKSPSK